MSYVPNMTRFPIPKGSTYKAVSGADGRQYMDGVRIIVVKGHEWGNAIGHVTLWNGTECSDTCHLMSDPDNGTFVPDIASIWVLP